LGFHFLSTTQGKVYQGGVALFEHELSVKMLELGAAEAKAITHALYRYAKYTY
jgi:hypothetical protein